MDSITTARLYEHSLQRSSGANSSKTCLCCLTSGDTVESIFSEDAKMVGMLWKCTSVCVRMDTGFPIGLCLSCRQDLIEAYDFRSRCQRTFTLLKKNVPSRILMESINGSQYQDVRKVTNELMKTCISCMASDFLVGSVLSMKEIIIQKLSKCAEITLHVDDGIPAGLCSDCRLILTKVYHFRTLCLSTDAILKKFLPVVTLSRSFVNLNDQDSNHFTTDKPNEDLEKEMSDNVECNDNFEATAVKIELNDGDLDYETDESKQPPTAINETTKGWQCNICIKSFKIRGRLTEHQKYHCINRLFWKCNCCKKEFKSSSLLEQHKATPNIHVMFKCNICKYKTGYKTNLRVHIESHKKIKKSQCKICKKYYRNKSTLRNHQIYNCVNKKSWKCRACKEIFESHKLLKEHKAMPNIHVLYKCDMCSYTNILKEELKQHIKTHYNEKLYKCDVCQRRYKSRKFFLKHKRFNCRSRSDLSCAICNKLFKTKNALEEHKNTPDIHRRYQCDMCSYSTVQKKLMVGHILMHSNKKSHKCDKCKKSFKCKASLSTHKKTICGNKRHLNCYTCHKRFESIEQLKKHKATPNVHPMYQCDICQFSTDRKFSLQHHLEVHSRNDQPKCDECDITFKSYMILVAHKKLHTSKKKTFFCYLCRKYFDSILLLEKHKATPGIHPTYKCDFCSYSGIYKYEVNKHMKSHSKN